MTNSLEIKIKRITKNNYYKFDNMVYWRKTGYERTDEEKELNAKKSFNDAYRELNHQDFYVFAAEYQNIFIGWISLIYMPKVGKWNKGVLYVDELWTSPEYRRRSVAYKLMNKAVDIQKQTQAQTIRLYTHNIAAQKLYEKCGFKELGNAIFLEKE